MLKLKNIFFAFCLFKNGFLIAENHEGLKDGFQESKKYNLVSELPDIYISKRTEQIGATWKEGHVWDKALIEKFYSVLKDQNDFFVVLDIGAQTGSFTLLAKYFPNSKWYAFEPINEAVDELKANLILNDIKNVSVYRACISNYSGESYLKLPKDTH
jgi:tRNA G46 methylase TrmB